MIEIKEFQISPKGYLVNVLTCGYTGYVRASQMAQIQSFEGVNLRGELLNVMWLVPLLAGLSVLGYTANLVFYIFSPSDAWGSFLNILTVYGISFLIFQLLSTLLALQLSDKIKFHSAKEKVMFTLVPFSQPIEFRHKENKNPNP